MDLHLCFTLLISLYSMPSVLNSLLPLRRYKDGTHQHNECDCMRSQKKRSIVLLYSGDVILSLHQISFCILACKQT